MVSGMAPDISVVIVSYKVPELLRACLASLQREVVGPSYEIIVVENASGDGTAEIVRDEFPAARLIALEQNIGFAAGSNLGARSATGEYVLLLNPDTELVGDTLAALLRYARAHPEAGLVGGRTLSPGGDLDPGSCWGAQSLWSLVCFASGLSTAFRRSQLFNPESLPGWERDSAREVDIVTGCLCLARRTIWEQLDGFDEAFFMYGEDADLAARAHKLGYRPAITPRGRDRPPRGCVLALRRQAGDESPLPCGPCPQALVASARDDRRGAAAGGNGVARARRRRRAQARLDLARCLAPPPILARRLRLTAERRQIDFRLSSEHEVGRSRRDRGRELESVAREAGADHGAIVDAIDNRRLRRRQRVATHVRAADRRFSPGPGQAGQAPARGLRKPRDLGCRRLPGRGIIGVDVRADRVATHLEARAAVVAQPVDIEIVGPHG